MHDDELIDRAAQAMTRGEPSDQLRPAVRARIDKGTSRLVAPAPWRRRKQARRLWIPAVVTATAIALAVIVTQWSQRIAPVPAPPPTRIAAAPSGPVPQVPARPVETPVRVSGPKRTPQRTLVVDPLAIEAISMPLIAVDSSSGVMPIEIDDLRVEPLRIE